MLRLSGGLPEVTELYMEVAVVRQISNAFDYGPGSGECSEVDCVQLEESLRGRAAGRDLVAA